MSVHGDDPVVAVARIDATLTAIARQIDAQERNAAQMVRSLDEKLSARFDGLKIQLETMDRMRETARREHEDEAERIQKRLAELEHFKARIIGIALGVSVATGGTVAAVMRLIGAG